jgi:hypothetical protein
MHAMWDRGLQWVMHGLMKRTLLAQNKEHVGLTSAVGKEKHARNHDSCSGSEPVSLARMYVL